MAHCNDLFQDFHQNIRILSSKRTKMMEAKDILRDKIRKHFQENHPEYKPQFFIQGSYKMKNGIRYKDDTADLDDGVYFDKKPDVTATTLQNWVYEAVEGHTEGGQQHKKKCIRVIYQGDCQIDLPIFYKTEDDDHPFIAVKDEPWDYEDDPKEFIDWFNDKKDENGQLIRITKYLKAWGDHKGHNMPSGLCMTILAAEHIEYEERDDTCFQKTLENIQESIESSWECFMPTTPYEDLFAYYDAVFERNFKDSLEQFVNDANKAITVNDKTKASKLWKKHLGERFPKYKDDDENSSSKTESGVGSLAAVASKNKPWGE